MNGPAIVVPRYKWRVIVNEILNIEGWTQRRVAAAIGVSQTWVGEVSRDVYEEITWHRGQLLLALHRQVLKRHSPEMLRRAAR